MDGWSRRKLLAGLALAAAGQGAIANGWQARPKENSWAEKETLAKGESWRSKITNRRACFMCRRPRYRALASR